ncbi:hypothetical protein CPB85DRAFT_1337628 [Mucidula mucida]|nr:hypothetical protein CPB85DRAFT_1337628 [Mucidula mucida]
MFSRRVQKAAEPLTRHRWAPARATRKPFRTTPAAAQRAYSTSSGSSSRLSPVFSALLVVGIGCTGYGLWELYGTLTMWPSEVRQDLRDALKAKEKNDLGLSAQYFHRAWTTVRNLPLDTLGEEPYLKLSGVAVALADVFEQDGQLEQAYNLYQEVLKIMQDATSLTGNERLRAVAIAGKIGEHAETLNKPQAEEEKYLQWAVEEVLRLVKEANAGEIDPDVDQLVLAELDLPPWASSTDVGAPLEALAGFYRRIGKIDFALPLYLQAIFILIPPPPQESPPEDQCRGAQLMGNISELILHRPGKLTPERLNQAESWAKQALGTLQKTRKLHEPIPICEVAYAAALFNVGFMREIAGDKSMASRFYTKGLEHSRAIGMQEGVTAAEESLKRLATAA